MSLSSLQEPLFREKRRPFPEQSSLFEAVTDSRPVTEDKHIQEYGILTAKLNEPLKNKGKSIMNYTNLLSL